MRKEDGMEMNLFEDRVKYDLWLQILLALSILVLVVLGFIFNADAHTKDILPGETAKESRIATLVVFAVAAFELLLYWAILPRRIIIGPDRVRIKCGFFHYRIPFSSIRFVRPARGIALGTYISFITSFKNQVEIERKKGLNIRFSPTQVELFLGTLNSALSDWIGPEQKGEIH